jgi:3-phenylpropionate/cinnamic acid dioxygenase small subunit
MTFEMVELATHLLTSEASALDEQRWDDWLALYFEDCEFWIPTWKSETELVSDPTREVSHMYYARRGPLEDRVFRVRGGRSPASLPMPRTLHQVSNIVVIEAEEDRLLTKANFVVHSFFQRQHETRILFGRYEHEYNKRDRWGIRRKKITVMNDYIISVLDFYMV